MHCRLGHVVRPRRHGLWGKAGHGADIDDACRHAFLRSALEKRSQCPREEEGGLDIQSHDSVELLQTKKNKAIQPEAYLFVDIVPHLLGKGVEVFAPSASTVINKNVELCVYPFKFSEPLCDGINI